MGDRRYSSMGFPQQAFRHVSVSNPHDRCQCHVSRKLGTRGAVKVITTTMRWQDVDGDTVNLIDAKTGPRQVVLNAPARAVLKRQPRSGSAFVFPSPGDHGQPLCSDLPLWYSVRREAGIGDVRIHDLRHSVANQAVARGVPLPTVARMLGHANSRMTLRYAHVGDRDLQAAAERIGRATKAAIETGESPAAASS